MSLDSATDLFNDVICVAGSFAAIFFMQVIAREPQRFVHVERFALLLLAFAMFFNGIGDVALIGGHRPQGIATNVAILLLLVVMTVRARFFNRDHSPAP
jgi:hypothetical protein